MTYRQAKRLTTEASGPKGPFGIGSYPRNLSGNFVDGFVENLLEYPVATGFDYSRLRSSVPSLYNQATERPFARLRRDRLLVESQAPG
jgi:hypothetical protein